MRNTELNGFVYDFSVDCNAVAVDDILDIHNYLMKKNDSIIKCLDLLNKAFYRNNIFVNFNKHKYVELYFNKQSRM